MNPYLVPKACKSLAWRVPVAFLCGFMAAAVIATMFDSMDTMDGYDWLASVFLLIAFLWPMIRIIKHILRRREAVRIAKVRCLEGRRIMSFSVLFSLITSLLLMLAFPYGGAWAESHNARSILLMTVYQQEGWGETFQFGALDADGNLWTYADSTRGEIPYQAEELLFWAETTDKLELSGYLSHDDLSDVNSLIAAVAVQDVVYRNVACDAGMQTSFAIRTGRDGNTEIIVLGASGDVLFENTDPSTPSLYHALRCLFPDVTAFSDDPDISPAGFPETDILTFCGFEEIDLTRLKMTAYRNICEEGTVEIEPAMDASEIMGIKVTGKKNSMRTTGDTISYRFEDQYGNTVAVFEFFDHLLVYPDGKYSISK